MDELEMKEELEQEAVAEEIEETVEEEISETEETDSMKGVNRLWQKA